MNTRPDTHWRTERARKRVDALVRSLMVALWATPLVLLLLLSCTAPATAASGRGTVYQVTSNGGSPATYTLTVNSTSDITVGDHLLAYTSTSSGVWLVTAKTSTTVTVQDSLTEGNGDVAHGAPSATGPRNVFAFSTPAANGLTLIPDASVAYASAALRRNAAETTAGTVAHAFVGASHTGGTSSAAARATLDLEPGTDVQTQDALLQGLANVTSASAGQFFVSTGYKGVTNRLLVAGDLPSHTHAAGTDLTGQVPIANGGTGAATAAANLVFAGPASGGSAAPSFRAIVAADLPAGLATLGAITTATHGHLFVATAQGSVVNLAPGSNDQVLTRDSTQPLGVKWAAAPGGSLATTLGAGNTTGGTDLILSDGDVLGIGGSSSTYPGMSYAGSAGEVFVGRADGTAGSFKFFGVPGSGASAGSPVSVQGGAAVNANAGAVNLSGGDSSNGNGGNAFLSGGSGGGSSSGGGVTLTSGAGGGGDGVVTLATPEGTKLTATTGVGVAISGSSAVDTTAGDAATINRMAGRFRKDTSGTTFTLTNSLISSSSIVILTFASDDATATRSTVSAGSGSATITFNAAPTANCDVNFMVVN